MHPSAHPVGPVRHLGFTLVEIMVAVVLIGLLAALAIPAFQRVQRASNNGRLVNDLRVFSQAFEIYNSQNGSWPDGAAAGVVPSTPFTMTGEFKVAPWAATTVIGGNWQWERDTADFIAGVSIVNFTCDDLQLTEIDTRLDDGNLTTGHFRKISATQASYVME